MLICKTCIIYQIHQLFQAIDMRWGVEYTENGWPSTETCLKELQHCRRRSIGPFVVVGQPSCITEQYIKCMVSHIPPINRELQKTRTCPILEEKYTRHGRYVVLWWQSEYNIGMVLYI